MIFVANLLSISINLLLIVFVIVCVLMGLLILMQRPKQEGLGAAFGGGVTDQVFGARTTNVLQRGTVYLGSAFFILSLTLAVLFGIKSKEKTLLEPQKAVVEKAAKAADKKTAAVEAKAPSIEDELKAAEAEAPSPTLSATETSPADNSTEAAPEPVTPTEDPTATGKDADKTE